MLRLIRHLETTSTLSVVDLTDVFSADFKTYCMQVSEAKYSTGGNTGLKIRYINSSGSVVTSGYSRARYLQRSDTGFTQSRSTSAAEFNVLEMDNNGSTGEFWFFQPFENTYTASTTDSSSRYGSNILGWQGAQLLNATTSITGVRLFTASNSISKIKLDLYGLRVS